MTWKVRSWSPGQLSATCSTPAGANRQHLVLLDPERFTEPRPAKGGVIGFTKALTIEYAGTGITANDVPPGFVDTP
ncbi:NAD(P)-dependent dehydrogenase (short-subunit alcohol dehydrogenase family) [Pseudonocardia parietis]|uniref:NAD(P)-dependent dehydrogenase (Short-subunit alcohol dehydrogenase family) n=1 Tax=Pseudonocardia parietis TaxID=570936 RepID=A0ABS4VU88_9PSEU|nr:NAD(P)-dependent dehydrogenase (short-subunit alcohol dehydrogenase family) [Pseudonocardia parietis]